MPSQRVFSRLRPVTPASSSTPAEVEAEHNPQPHAQLPSEISSLEEQAITHATQLAVALASPAERPQSPVDPDRKPQKKALLIGICRVADPPEYQKDRTVFGKKFSKKRQSTGGVLKGPHKDVEATRKLLIEKYGYHPDDIVSLVDTETQEEGLLPTKDNIMKQIKLLLRWAKAGDRFYFHFSGHSGQVPTTDIREYDLMDEFIWTSDGKTIMDDVLRAELVDKVPKNASLTVVFDSCTSGTLLDLDHWHCNQIYVPWVNKGTRKTDSLWIITRRRLAAFMSRLSRISGSRSSSYETTEATRREEIFDENTMQENGRAADASSEGINGKTVALSSFHGLKRYHSPVSIHCNGYCERRSVPWISNNVVCLSSAADGQKTYEDGNGTSMTVALINLLEREPHPTLERVLTLVSFELHQKYVTLHAASRSYRKQVREFNAMRLARGKSPRIGKEVEMNNFQTPQLSSHQPLDMERLWNP